MELIILINLKNDKTSFLFQVFTLNIY